MKPNIKYKFLEKNLPNPLPSFGNFPFFDLLSMLLIFSLKDQEIKPQEKPFFEYESEKTIIHHKINVILINNEKDDLFTHRTSRMS